MEGINGVMPTYEINKNGGDGYGWGGGMWFAWILILFVLMGGWGNGFGGMRGAQAGFDVASQFDYQDIKNGIRGVQEGINAGFYAQARDLCQGFAGINANINEARFAAQQCCCETNRNIDSVRYDAQKNTCDIINAIHAEGEATRSLIQANEVQALRDKVQNLELRDAMCGVVRYPNSWAYNAGTSPFCGCNTGCCNI